MMTVASPSFPSRASVKSRGSASDSPGTMAWVLSPSKESRTALPISDLRTFTFTQSPVCPSWYTRYRRFCPSSTTGVMASIPTV